MSSLRWKGGQQSSKVSPPAHPVSHQKSRREKDEAERPARSRSRSPTRTLHRNDTHLPTHESHHDKRASGRSEGQREKTRNGEKYSEQRQGHRYGTMKPSANSHPLGQRADDHRGGKVATKPVAAQMPAAAMPSAALIEVICNDRLGKKIRVKCSPDDTVGDFKKLLAAQIGTAPEKIVLKKWYNSFKDHVTLSDYEIHNGMSLEMYYN